MASKFMIEGVASVPWSTGMVIILNRCSSSRIFKIVMDLVVIHCKDWQWLFILHIMLELISIYVKMYRSNFHELTDFFFLYHICQSHWNQIQPRQMDIRMIFEAMKVDLSSYYPISQENKFLRYCNIHVPRYLPRWSHKCSCSPSQILTFIC